ncbi:TPM domain-containing protein [Pseudomonas aeruginosa]
MEASAVARWTTARCSWWPRTTAPCASKSDYGIEGALSDVVSRRIIDEVITPRLRQGDFDGGIAAGAEQIMRVIDGEALPAADPRRQGADQRHRGRPGPSCSSRP